MVVTIKFEEQHNDKWYIGYEYDCKSKFKKNVGPKNGTPIKISHLPISGRRNYLRFWGAMQNNNNEIWNNINEAYDETGDIEKTPPLSYYNGGFVEIDRQGKARIRLELPSKYINNIGEKEPPHLHFRICSENKMSRVYTMPLLYN